MTMPGSFRAQLRLPQMAGSRLTDALIKGMGAEPLEETAQGTRLAHTFGRIAVETQASGLDISLDADDRTSLAYLQLSISHRLQSLEKGIELPWDSDNRPGMLLPYFRKMQVVSTQDLTPSMRRVRLAGEDLERFSRNGLHMRLLFPPAGSTSPSWPQIGRNGDAVWPDDENRPVARVYTIRTIDVAAGLIDVDMVLHEGDAYPGAGWAARAKPGDIVGMTGPGGGEAPHTATLVLLGDETALPAIGRILEGLPKETNAIVRIEIASEEEKQPLSTRATLDLEWLVRGNAEAGTTTLLEDAVKALDIKGDDPDLFVWAGCEFSAFKSIRSHLRKELRLPNRQHLVVSYWRRGVAGVH